MYKFEKRQKVKDKRKNNQVYNQKHIRKIIKFINK